MQRVPQPPVRPAQRDREVHDFWPGFAAGLIAVILLFCGARRSTSIDTVEGGSASEPQLIRAFAFDGLQFADQIAPTPPPTGNDPEAFERWEKQNREREAPGWKVRVDTAAKTPCPT
jgi:hypothetical protein